MDVVKNNSVTVICNANINQTCSLMFMVHTGLYNGSISAMSWLFIWN